LRILKVPEKRIEELSTSGFGDEELQSFLSNANVPVDQRYIAPQDTLNNFKAIVGDLKGASAGVEKTPVPRRENNTECPICFEEFSTGKSTEPVLHCKWGCGNAVHQDCFDKWSASKAASGQEVTCVYCRAPWETRESSKAGSRQILSRGRLIRLKNPYAMENIAIQRELLSKASRKKKSTEGPSKTPRKKKTRNSPSGTSEGVKKRKIGRKKGGMKKSQ
jgi:hypothetical protein